MDLATQVRYTEGGTFSINGELHLIHKNIGHACVIAAGLLVAAIMLLVGYLLARLVL